MRNFWQDVRFGLRVLSKSSSFAAIAILTLALGIGANTALFSVVNGVLLNPLPFPDPDALLAVYSQTSAFRESSISYPNFLDWHKDNKSFASLSAFRSEDYNMTAAGEPERLHGHMISAEFFPTLGVKLAAGRNILAEEDQAGAAPVVVIGDALWKRKFGSSADGLGKSIAVFLRNMSISPKCRMLVGWALLGCVVVKVCLGDGSVGRAGRGSIGLR